MTTVQQRMAAGVVWMVAARIADRAIGVVSMLVLARLLLPDDFGLVAMATAIGAVLDLLGAFNFDLALIQRKDANKSDYDTVWTFNVMFGCFCAVSLLLLAAPAAVFYREPRLDLVMCALALVYFVDGFTNVGIVDFRKELRFRDEFAFIMYRRVITFVATIACALWLRSYWALVAGMLVGRLSGLYLSYRMSGYRPTLALSAAGRLFHFSKWLFLNNVLLFLSRSGPNFIIGRMNGASGLGVYTLAYEISNLPTTELVAPISRATFPGFSKMHDTGLIATSYVKLLGIIALLILPIGIGIAAVAEPLVQFALGPQWEAAIPLIELLAIYGAISATQANNGIVWMALGRPRDVAMSVSLFLILFAPLLYFLLLNVGVLGAGYAYLIAYLLHLPFVVWNTKRLLALPWLAFAQPLWRPTLGVIAMYSGVKALDDLLVAAPAAIRLCAECLLGATIYAALVLALWVAAGRPIGAERFCLQRVFRLRADAA
jgi:O-antigen/teichoic acid export membrane protein